MFFAKRNAINRINFLLPREEVEFVIDKQEQALSPLELYLKSANLNLNPILLLVVFVIFSAILCSFLSQYISIFLLPFVFIGLQLLLYLNLEKRIEFRAHLFAADYPTVLMATASSVKAGLTPYAALERSINLLPKDSLVKDEIVKLLKSIRNGESKKKALQNFGRTVRQPDLELFREAFLIVLDHGGRFAPTLERLALVCRDRTSLIRSAKVSTASMQMTANVLLLITPLIVGLVAVRTKDFFLILFTNTLANTLGMTGVLIILLSYGLLIKMSSFKP